MTALWRHSGVVGRLTADGGKAKGIQAPGGGCEENLIGNAGAKEEWVIGIQ